MGDIILRTGNSDWDEDGSFICKHFYGQVGETFDSEWGVKLSIWWRFIDDIFIVWTEGEEKLNGFIDYLNNAHDTIKFTNKWSEHEIEFLDVKVLNESGVLETDVFIKPTDSHQYLHHSSCHPGACKRSIPFAQAMRLRRICSKSCFFEKRAEDLVEFLTDRGYRKAYVESSR